MNTNQHPTLTGPEILSATLVDEGTTTVLGYLGGAILRIYDALRKFSTIHHIFVRHEQRAAHLASRHRTPLAFSSLTALVLAFSLLGCKPTPPPTPTPTPKTQQIPAPIRPTTAPPAFKLFHQTADSFTLVTTPTATDDQISAIIWQLRDAAHARTFDTLHIPQKVVDARDPMVWFHIYRGPKCADEKYTSGKLPCGASYHAAGDYTFGGGADHQWDDGVLLHDETHQTELWPAGSPYNASPPATPASL